MLELAGVSAADGDDAAVHVELADDGHASFQLRTEGLRGAATQTQQADQDVLLGVLVGEEGLPAAVSHIVPPHQLHLSTHSSLLMFGAVVQKNKQTRLLLNGSLLFCNQCLEQYNTILRLQDAVHYLVRSDFVVDLLNAHFSGSHVSTLHTEKHSHASNQLRNSKSRDVLKNLHKF